MLPLGHLAFAYLLYVPIAYARRHPLPAAWALLPLAFGSQFPDLVDKPLAYLEILTYGRSLAHSLAAFFLLSGLVWWLVRRQSPWWQQAAWRRHLRPVTPLAFAVGYAAHILGDALDAILAGTLVDARWVLWPLFTVPESPTDDIPPWIRLLRIYQDMETHPQLEFLVAAMLVFVVLRLGAEFRGWQRPPTVADTEADADAHR